MRQVSAFIIEMARAISADLRESVAPDKLQNEVEKELEKQTLAQLVRAISEYSSARDYIPDQVATKRRQVLRFMGYCSEMWTAIAVVRGAIAAESRSTVSDDSMGLDDVEEGEFEIVDRS